MPQLLLKHMKYISHFREVLYVLRLWKMDTGAKCSESSDTEYTGAPWEWRPLGIAAPGSGGHILIKTLSLTKFNHVAAEVNNIAD